MLRQASRGGTFLVRWSVSRYPARTPRGICSRRQRVAPHLAVPPNGSLFGAAAGAVAAKAAH